MREAGAGRGDFNLSVELGSLFVGIFPPFPAEEAGGERFSLKSEYCGQLGGFDIRHR